MVGRILIMSTAFIGFAAVLDTSFMIPIIALYALELGANEVLAGLTAGLYSLVSIPASVVAGILIDKFGRKRMLSLGLLSDAIFVLLYGLVKDYMQLMLVRGAHALGGSLVLPAFIAKAREISDIRVGFTLGTLLAPLSIAMAIGSMLSGILTASLGYRTSFTIVSLIILLAFILSLMVPERCGEKSWRGLNGIVDGFREVGLKLASGLWLIFTLFVALGLLTGGLAVSLATHGVVAGEVEARLISGIGFGLSSLVSAMFFVVNGFLADKRGLRFVTLYSASLSALGFIVAALYVKPMLIIISLALLGVGLAGLMLSSTILVTTVPAKARGTAVGLQQVLNVVGIAIGAPLGGLLAILGPGAVLITSGLVIMASLFVIKLV